MERARGRGLNLWRASLARAVVLFFFSGAAVSAMNANIVDIGGYPVINNLRQAQKFAANLKDYEMVTASLYDSQVLLAGSAPPVTIPFFQSAAGGGTAVFPDGTTNASTNEDTDMTAAGQVPANQAFIVTAIELLYMVTLNFSASALPADYGPSLATYMAFPQINNIWLTTQQGYLTFKIGSKVYLQEGPLKLFSSSVDLEIDGAQATANTKVANGVAYTQYAKSVGPAYNLAPHNLLLIPNQNFNVTLSWGTLTGLVEKTCIRCRLLGQLLRAAQ
jgi:hypothetical protein